MDDDHRSLEDRANQELDAAPGRQSQATRLVGLVRESGAQLWHDADGDAYLTLRVDGHQEHWPLRSRGCRSWLARRMYQREDRAPSNQALADALQTLEGQAAYDGPEHPVHVRLAEHDGHIYIDLGDPAWRAVEVSADGWRIVTDPPVRFRRPRGLSALPDPQPGDIHELRRLLGWDDDETWAAVVSWLLMAYRPSGPYPVLILRGQAGAGKSTVARALRGLVDPSTVPLRTVPRTEQDLLVAARAGWIIAADNLSGCPVWLSDALCRLATGGGWSARQLYTDTDEVLISACRPVLMTGIDLAPERHDLLDRAVIVDLPTSREQRAEADWWADYERIRPRVLGAMLDAVSMALARLPQTQLADMPRMADYARWISAAEPALGWSAGRALAVYREQRRDAVRTAMEGSPLAAVLSRWISGDWMGAPSELYTALCGAASATEQRARSWPGSAAAMTSQLMRLAPGLAEAEGIHVMRDRIGHARRRVITIHIDSSRISSSALSASSAPQRRASHSAALREDAMRTTLRTRTTPRTTSSASSSAPHPRRARRGAGSGDADDADDADDDMHPSSGVDGEVRI